MATDEYGDTLLHLAAKLNHVNVLSLLLNAWMKTGQSIDVWNKASRTPLMESIPHLECFKLLLPHSKNNVFKHGTWSTLMICADKGLVQQASLLLQVDDSQVSLVNKDGWNALHLAVRAGSVEIVELLLEKDSKGRFNQTRSKRWPIHTACFHGHLDIVKALLKQDAVSQLEAKDSSGTNCTGFAVLGGHSELLTYLSKNSADLMTRDSLDRNLIHLASQAGHLEIIEQLVVLEPGLRNHLNDKDNFDSWTPLHYAAREGHLPCIQLLLSYNLALLPDCHNRTPQDILTIHHSNLSFPKINF